MVRVALIPICRGWPVKAGSSEPGAWSQEIGHVGAPLSRRDVNRKTSGHQAEQAARRVTFPIDRRARPEFPQHTSVDHRMLKRLQACG